ncbi:MAG: aminoacyl-tRNA hydrolase [Alphaproteobacteria bacterium]|nr:aminoacyl-tRNA hydrolase [Alphaproteobacteria bacterium]
MRAIVGLGNPGDRYRRNRHNIGFLVVDAIARKYGFATFRTRFQGRLSEGALGGERSALFKPQTYMNESGRAVAALMRFYKLQPADVIVVHDELDLAPGKVRVKHGGGNAGHRGLASIDGLIGKDYWRVRIGVGHPGRPSQVISHVLEDFEGQDDGWLGPTLDAIAEAAPLLVRDDAGKFMNQVSLTLKPPRPKPPKPPQPTENRD